MPNSKTILGLILIASAILFYIPTKEPFFTATLLLTGLALIIFNKQEYQIEKRKDIKTKQPSK